MSIVRSLIGVLVTSLSLCADTGEFQEMVADFGKMQTVAGKLSSVDSDHDWRISMEGKDATAADLSRPHMAMADALGNIYIADKESHGIRKIDLEGKITTVAGMNLDFSARGNGPDERSLGTDVRLNSPNGLYTLPDGTTYIVDLGNHKIRKLSPDGMMVTVITDSPSNTVTRGLGTGRALWVSPDERTIYFSGPGMIKRWTAGGDGELGSVEVWANGFVDLSNIDVDPTDGNVVATDRNLNKAYRVIPSGEPPYSGTANAIAGNGFTGRGVSGVSATQCALPKVRGIAFRSDGTYFLAAQGSGRIWFVDSCGIIHLVIDGDDSRSTHAGDNELITSNPTTRKLSEPRSITIAPNGDLLIVENDRGFVRRVTQRNIPLEVTRFKNKTLEWRSHREGRYRVEYSETMRDLDWMPLSTVDGASGSLTSVDDPTNAFRRFYRVVELLDE